MSSQSNLDPEMRRRRYRIVRRKTCEPCNQVNMCCDGKNPTCLSCELNGLECTWVMHVTRVKDSLSRQASQEPDVNENESSHFDGHVETAEGSSERILSLEELRTEFKDFANEENKRPSEEDDVEMAGTEDERFNFSTVTQIYPMEGYYIGTPNMEDEDPKPPEDDEDHEPPRLARLVSLHARHLYPPSVSGLPSEYHQFNQDSIIKTYFDGVNPAYSLFSEQDYEYFDTECRECREKGTVSIQEHSIFVMLALSLRNDPKNHYQGDEELFIRWASRYVDNEHNFSEPYLMQWYDIASSVTEISYEEGGILHSEDKSKHFEILRFRAELATIQGKIFDLVYSVRASELSSDQRETVADRLDEMLEEWVESIPEAYRGDTLSGFGYVQLRFFKQLRVTYYHCIFSIRQATLRNKEWVKRLLKFGEARNGDESDTPLLPSNWSGLVTAARRCLDIVSKVDSRDMAFRWSCTHSTQAAMAILAANNITLSEHDIHDSTEKDQQRLHIAHGEVSDRLDEDPTGGTEKAFNTCGELIIKARESVRQFNESKSMEES
ncbi:hypothetical protein FNYG_00151 [Fusarium nygamai]|uniref:Zn(2)-C6 fungal-type domain-containing protein n=1 Tax=Gibberella nygamai TaxID=42673 RepID=A0A2K0WVZ8_GIBNY|nr:hypothetical protein FNYG_00151 [Fusarium nygamai]